MNEKTQAPRRASSRASRTKYPLPAEGASFARHWEILKAYVAVSKEGKEPVSYTAFGRLTVAPTTISGNNRFFEHLGLITGAKGTKGKYVPTETTLQLIRALNWSKEEEAKMIVRRILANSWFWNSAKMLLNTRGQATAEELIQQLGYDCNADPSAHQSSIEVLIEYLKFSGFVAVTDGMLVLSESGLDSQEKGVKEAIMLTGEEQQVKTSEGTERTRARQVLPVLLGIMVTPDMTEEQIRKAVRVALDELSRMREDG